MEKAPKSLLLARLFVIAALAAAIWMVRCHTGVVNSDEAGIVLALPERAAAWNGDELFHCSALSCGRPFLASSLPPGSASGSPCPVCGAPLDTMNPAERSMLPPDTGLVRKQYIRSVPPYLPLTASIVLSGNDRTSIHRPQVCMVAAGYDIENERVVAIDMGPGKPPLEVTVLDMVHPPSDDTPAPIHIFYAYWFIGKGRVTPSHVQRMIWMATDRIFHGISHRWAYVAVSGLRDPGSNFYLQEIADFASALHPQILRPDFVSLDPTVAH